MANIWIFGYGSLLWDAEPDARNFKKATLHGWHREYNQLSRVSRGTEENKGIVLGLEEGGTCEGYLFQIPENKFNNWKAREGVNSGNYLLKSVLVDRLKIVLDGQVLTTECYTVVSNKRSDAYVGTWSLEARAQQAINSSNAGGGRRGTSVDYIKNNFKYYKSEGINDKALTEMHVEVQRLLGEESHAHTHLLSSAVTDVEVYDSPVQYSNRYQISNDDLIIGLPKEIMDVLHLTGRWDANETVVVHHGLRKVTVKAVQTDSRLTSMGSCRADNPANHCWMTPAVRTHLSINSLPRDHWTHRINYPAFKTKYESVKISKD